MIEITADVYAWLTSIDMFEDDENEYIENSPSIANFTVNEKGNVLLEEKFQTKIKCGTFYIKLFEKMNQMLNTLYGNIYKMDTRISNIIEEDSAGIKLKNFEIILDIVKNYYGIVLNNDYKTLLVASDNPTIFDFFNRLYDFYLQLEDKVNKMKREEKPKKNDNGPGNVNSLDHFGNGKVIFHNFLQSENSPDDPTKPLPKIRFREDFVDIDELESTSTSNKLLSQTRSVLEFIIVAICRSFNMTAKQSAALLADNKKYLTHILVKGLSKQNFKPVKQLYQEILQNLGYFVQLVEINSIAYPNQISKNIEMSLSTFKPGLLSKNLDVVYISGRVLTKLAFEFIEKNLISSAWDWFIMPGGGLESSILCLKKHDLAVEVVVSLLTNFGRFHLFELFSIYLKTYLQNEGTYFSFLSDIMEKLSQLKFFTDEFVKNKIKNYFLELIEEGANSFNINCKIECIGFIAELWIHFSIYIEDEEENFKILNTLKRLARDNNRLIQYAAIAQLFRILSVFAKERNSFAPTIYKTLTFNLIENHNDFAIKEFIISNFSHIFKIIMSIPVGILVEPYIKQINVSLGLTYFFNLIDINFLITLTRHPRLNIKDAIIILDILGQIYFQVDSGIYFYSIVRSVFTMVLSRYLMHEVGVEFCFKYTKLIIETFCKLDKPLSDKIYVNSLAMNLNPEEVTNLIVLKDETSDPTALVNIKDLTKSAIIEMVIDILQINNTFINNVIKSLLICADLRHFRIYAFHNIGLSKALEHFGNYNDIVHYYNINEDELDIDKDFELVIELIFDRLPSVEGIIKRKNLETAEEEVNEKLATKEVSLPSLPPTNNGNKIKIKKEQLEMMKKFKEEADQKLKKKKNNIKKSNLEGVQAKLFPSVVGGSIVSKKLDNNYELLDISKEEDRDLIVLKKLIKDYNRFFRYVFMKYCGSMFHPVHGKLFNSIKEIAETISPSEIVKMFREHDIAAVNSYSGLSNGSIENKLVTKDEILLLVGLMNMKIFRKPNSKAGLSFDEFIEVFIQIAFFCFSRPPYIYANYSIAEYTLEMIKLFSRHVMNSNMSNFNLVEYQHPDDLMTPAEAEMCNLINKKLRTKSLDQHSIPDNYRKFLDTEINNKYFVPDCMRSVLTESQIICLELVYELMFKCLKVHCLESFAYAKEVYKVRPVFIPSKLPVHLKNNINDMQVIKTNRRKNKHKTSKKEKSSSLFKKEKEKEIRLNSKRGRPPIDTRNRSAKDLKEILQKAGHTRKNRSTRTRSLYSGNNILISETSAPNNNTDSNYESEDNNSVNLEGNVKTNSNNPESIKKDSVKSASSKNVINNIQLNKIINEERQKLFEKEKERKRRLRTQYIKQELEKMKEQKKEKEQKREELVNEEKRKKEDKMRKKLETETKLREKIKSELDKIKQQKSEEERVKLENEKKQKIEIAKRKAELNDVFYNKQVARLKEEFKKITDERKLEEAKKRLENKFKDKKLEEERKKFNEYFEKEKKAKETEKKLYSQVDNLVDRKDISEVLDKYNEHILLLNEIYTTTRKSGVNKNSNLTTSGVHLDEFQLLCLHFNITNLLLDNNEIQLIFKKIANKMDTPGYLSLDSFKLSLIYICLFSLKHFKPIHDETNSGDNNKTGPLGKPPLPNLKSTFKISAELIEAMDGQVLTQFLEYLGLQIPFNRREIENYINLQKNISVKEKSKLLKDKSSGLLNVGELSRIKPTKGRDYSTDSRLLSDNSILID